MNDTTDDFDDSDEEAIQSLVAQLSANNDQRITKGSSNNHQMIINKMIAK